MGKRATLLCCFMLMFLQGCQMSQLEGAIRPENPFLKPKIAIISENRLANALGTKLFTKGFAIIERLRLVAVLREKSLQMSGLTDEQLIEAGKVLNVDAIIFVETSGVERGDIYTAYIKIVSVKSGAIMGSFNYQNGRGPTKDSFNEAADKLTDAINNGYQNSTETKLDPPKNMPTSNFNSGNP